MPKRLRCVYLIAMLIVSVSLRAQSPIQYAYDANGRLIGVIDPAGDTAVYSYDAVGNLLSIDRHASSQVSVVSFSPGNGLAGTTVTIVGTGFSATPAQDAVTFNGTTATVTSATTSTLIVTVPSGATTGTIGVTAPAGSATSPAAFTVGAAGSAPTISSFYPAIAQAGSSLTVNGTQFLTNTALDRLGVNVELLSLSGATSTALTGTVSSTGTSGKVTVVTPYGSAVSSSDLFVAPTGYTASQVDATYRLSFGTWQSATIATTSHVGLLVFDGTVGQRVSTKFTGTGLTGQGAIYTPNDRTLTTASLGNPAFIEPITLPVTGTYTVLFKPTNTMPATGTTTVYDVHDLTGTVTVGSPASLGFTTPGQNAHDSFSGTSAHRYSVVTADGTPSPGILTTTLLDADGTMTLGSSSGLGGFIEPVSVSGSATYFVTVDPFSSGTGNATVTVYDVPADLSGTITPGGSSVNAALSTPGQNALYTVGTPTNSRVSVKMIGGPLGTATVKQSNGTTVVSGSIGSFLDAWTFASGQTITLDPGFSATGTSTLTLYDVPADTTGTVTIGGSATGVSVSTPGQNALLTFSGTAAQHVTVHVASNTVFGVTVKLLSTDGTTVLASTTSSSGSFNLSSVTLPSTGTYTIKFDPSAAATGGANISVTSP